MTPIAKPLYSVNRPAKGRAARSRAATPDPALGAGGSPRRVEPLGATPRPPLLVSYPISQTDSFHLYPVSLRVKRSGDGRGGTPPDRSGTVIDGFSDKSKGRLRFLATNSGHLLGTQFCMTYHDNWPNNGTEFKRHLNIFLTRLRKSHPEFRYIWIAEFQTRGAPHYHLYSNIPRTNENRRQLAQLWNEIVDPGNRSHLAFHLHRRNFINWEMKYGNYLCKYLDKSHQKCIPDNFTDMKRWWGNSRNLLPEPQVHSFDSINEQFGSDRVDLVTGEVENFTPSTWLIRQIGRHHERVNRRSWFRRTPYSTASLSGGSVFRQLVAYLDRQPLPPDPKSPF